jgi:DUF1009 family protein
MKPLGLLAGNGRFPFLVAQEARKNGRRVVCVAFNEEADPALENYVDVIHWIYVGQLDKWIKTFKAEGVQDVVMVGLVRHSNMYADIKKFRLDVRAMKMFWNLKDRKADTILSAIGEEFAKDGLKLIPSIEHLSHCLAPKGVMTKRKPTSEEADDIVFGYKIAKAMAGQDIGQTVCVKNKAVIAVEAMEGTDQCIKRAGTMAQGNFVITKVAKPKQDLRFDVPVIGLNTIETFREAGGGVLAVEAGKTLILDREKLLEWANSEKICIVGVDTEGHYK